ncbi:hypothetical protein SAMN06264364_10647 [Quadrisphaera granulorum]|uniref:Uncharacterized protein n=1 Tax=Quadrisphaera granulorum TaxID=317664 RepID=A0A316ACH8_9ACTN|nr:hypothetical protein BXY45_10647 [Quadrisphaera granulorum]SZE95966.1 hypothetical protein SAMN06264364_10647 [Quadrisphaera granulorum]
MLNSADPGTPTAAEVVTAVADAMGVQVEVVDDDERGEVSPWSTWPPFFLDTSASLATGYRPVGTHAETVVACVEELVGRLRCQPGG